MADHTTHVPVTPLVKSGEWSRCSIHGPPWQCAITEMGYAIYYGDSAAIGILTRRGFSANRGCHMGLSLQGDFPLKIVTSSEYYHRPDDCFLALVEAGADPRFQARTMGDLASLKEQLMVFAFRPKASLDVLKAVLKMDVADTERARERVMAQQALNHSYGKV